MYFNERNKIYKRLVNIMSTKKQKKKKLLVAQLISVSLCWFSSAVAVVGSSTICGCCSSSPVWASFLDVRRDELCVRLLKFTTKEEYCYRAVIERLAICHHETTFTSNFAALFSFSRTSGNRRTPGRGTVVPVG